MLQFCSIVLKPSVCYGYCLLQLDEQLHHTVSSRLQQVCALLHTKCIQYYNNMHLQVASSQRICCQSMIFPSHLYCHASRVVATPTVYWHHFPSLTLAISTRSSLVALSKDQCGEQGMLGPIVVQLNLALFPAFPASTIWSLSV